MVEEVLGRMLEPEGWDGVSGNTVSGFDMATALINFIAFSAQTTRSFVIIFSVSGLLVVHLDFFAIFEDFKNEPYIYIISPSLHFSCDPPEQLHKSLASYSLMITFSYKHVNSCISISK